LTALAQRAVDCLRAGSGRLFLVTGEAGVGKSRLAGQVRDAVAGAGVATVWTVAGRPGAPAFWPWRQLLTALPSDVGRSRGRRLLLGAASEPMDRFALFDDVVGLLRRAAAARPLLVVMDDLHEADAATLLLLEHVAPRLPEVPLVFVATVRPGGGADPQWVSRWAELLRYAETIEVGPLSVDQIRDIVAAATNQPVDAGLLQRVAARTGGNALFVCELARQLALAAHGVERLPPTVRAIIEARLAERSAACRRLLGAASAVGVRAPLAMLVDMLGEPVEQVDVEAREARAHGLAEPGDPDALTFAHEIVRDAVYDLLPASDRHGWHRSAGAYAASVGDATAATLHFGLAGPHWTELTAQWALIAGRTSLAMLAYEDAAGQFRRALDGADEPGEVYVLLGGALLAAGDADGARAAHLAAVELARARTDGALLADAVLGLGAGSAGFEIGLNDRAQVAALEDALALIDPQDRARRAMLLARLSVALTFVDDEARRRALATDALGLAREGEDDAAAAAALAAFCDVISGPEHSERRIELSSEIVQIAQRRRDPALELLGRRQRLVAWHEIGDLARVDEEVRAYEHTSRALHQPLYGWYVPLWRAAEAFGQGRIGDCRRHLNDARSEGERASSANATALVATITWFLAGELADQDALRHMFEQFELDDASGPWVPITRTLHDAQLGNWSAARARLDTAVRLLESLPRDSEWLSTTTQAAEAVALVGGHPVAAWLYQALLPFADRFIIEGIGAVPRGSVERHLGQLAASPGTRVSDQPRAREHFDRALAANQRLGAALLVARTYFDAGTLLDDEDLRAEARQRYAGIGAPYRLALLDAAAHRADAAALRREGGYWTARFAGRTATVPDSKGMRDIAALIARPGQPVPAVELATAAGGLTGQPATHLGDVVDATARRAYRNRLAQLQVEADEADRTGDAQRSAAIAAEQDALVGQLKSAYGLGNRPRRAGDLAERARSTVTARIRDAIRRIEATHPELGRHLRISVRTGSMCSYEPETPVPWRFSSHRETPPHA
jgi:hypothetical protein